MTTNTSSTVNINKALVSAIAETTDVHADSNNPFHKSKYASLSAHLLALKPVFSKHGLAIVQFPHSDDNGGVGVLTRIIHTSGEYIESAICVPNPQKTKTNKEGQYETESGMSGQQAGALISYLRRYSLASVSGVATDDDDAETDRSVRSSPQEFKPSSNYKANASAPSEKFQSQTIPQSVGVSDLDPTIVIPFGNNKGTPIGELSKNELEFWANKWEPRPWEKTGKVTKKDATLKATAIALFNGNAPAPAEQDTVTQDDVPF
jgi:hypothetical protein